MRKTEKTPDPNLHIENAKDGKLGAKEYVIGALEADRLETVDDAIREIYDIRVHFKEDIPNLVTALKNEPQRKELGTVWRVFQDRLNLEFPEKRRREQTQLHDLEKYGVPLSKLEVAKLAILFGDAPSRFEFVLNKYIKNGRIEKWEVPHLEGLKDEVVKAIGIYFFNKNKIEIMLKIVDKWDLLNGESLRDQDIILYNVVRSLALDEGPLPIYKKKCDFAIEKGVFRNEAEIDELVWQYRQSRNL